MFEAVAGPTSRNPDVPRLRVAVENEMPVPSLLILAHARLQKRRAAHRRKPEFEIPARSLQALLSMGPLTRGWVEGGSANVRRNLQPSPLIPRDAVELPLAVINPHRQSAFIETPLTRGRAEEENFLARRRNECPQHLWEHTAQPRAAGEEPTIGAILPGPCR